MWLCLMGAICKFNHMKIFKKYFFNPIYMLPLDPVLKII